MIKSKKITAFCMAVMLIVGSLPLFASGAAEGATDIEKSLDALINYSDGADSYKEVAVADLLRLSSGVSVTAAEKEYFSICEISLKYSDNVPANSVSYKRTDSGYIVTAAPYSYTAKNGVTVDWIPASVTVNGVKKNFSGGKYEMTFTGLEEGETYEFVTTYTTKITVPLSTLKTLANAGFDEGQRVKNDRKTYEDALAVYERETEKYEKEYVDYLVKNNEYKAYVKALARYNAEKAEYEAYVAAKAQYDRDYAAWLAYSEAYEKYEKALADFEEKNAYYEEQYGLYADSYAALSACKKSMEVLESIFISDSAGHTMYSTLMGDTVATVVARRSELIDYGANAEDIDNAGDATECLIALLSPYRSLKTNRERFNYYQKNYRAIKSQFVRLYAALHSLANYSLVRMELSKKGKLERYYQFVAQLYVISTGLDDDVTFSSGWNVRGYGAASVLESSQLVTDRNSSNPEGLTYPEHDELPEAPVRPEEPKKVEKPQLQYASEVTEPAGPPAAVAEPVEPKKPTVKRPEAPVFTAQQLLLENEINEGRLKQRVFSSTQPMTFRTTLSHTAVFSSSDVFVSFYDYDYTTLLYSEKVSVGGDASYRGKTPSRKSDVKNTYTFSGWVDENGKPASFTNLESDKAFYASYTATPVKYTVTFELKKEKVSAEFVYGDRPVCPKEVTSYSEKGIDYIFDGWSPSLTLVTGNITYTAKYRENDGRFTVSFDVLGTQTDYRLAAGEMPTPPEAPGKYIDGMYLYEFSGWSPEIMNVTGNTVYTAEYSKTAVVPTERGTGAEVTENASYICADCTGKGMADYSKLVSYAKEAGKGVAFIYGETTVWIASGDLSSLDSAERFEATFTDNQLELVFKTAAGDTPSMNLTVPVSFAGKDMDTAHVYEKSADGQTEITPDRKDGAFLLRLTGSNTYVFAFSYVIQTESVGAGYVKTNIKTAEKGETVEIAVQPDSGAALKELYITANGIKTTLTENAFVMPDCDVTVTAVFEKLKYVIVFYDGDGKEISRQICLYGDMPALPDEPEKEGDENTVYAFAGWEPEVMPVSADAEYRPVFKAGARVGGDDYKTTPQLGIFTKILPKIALVLLPVGALTALIIILIRKKRKKIKKV